MLNHKFRYLTATIKTVNLSLTPVESCRLLFNEYDILPVFSLYVLECSKFVRNYPDKFVKISDLPKQQRKNEPIKIARTVDENINLFVHETSLNVSSQDPQIMTARIYNKL